ncbi:hypothetical protein SAMN05421788_10284 [Filimonas lacunae]|uniref:DUF1223 domain-containing protein n=1 Tax=Filimonas lacunae TaxID=477680 RepID=A0A173MI37_9BACT|nr:DUF1223 domain-containing protein [Filimonas lacunae]BAV07292.1 hypothetical protein that often co-occurs with aconitase [Filimonas lacunae]SIS91887.1 hypothetical protein SAMN05421788_10284 [Filimonas lacunae]
MKPANIAAVGISAVLTLFTAAVIACNITTAKPKEIPPATPGKGFAVLELFTSEGCSSCPPADALLAQIQQVTDTLPVYVLAYHVDYWRRQGWKDIFSSPQNEERQYHYSQQLGEQVYTPQLIINGKTSIVGSDAPNIQQALQNELNSASANTLQISGTQQNNRLQFQYQLTGNTRNMQLLIAVVQKHGVSQVTRGENAGHTLSHVAIVRQFQTWDIKGNSGSGQVQLAQSFQQQDNNLVGFLQNIETGEITAAANITL